MGWLLFGLFLLALGLHPKVYELVHWAPNEEESSDSRILRLVIRCVLTIVGVIFTAVNVPNISGLSHPGWFVGGVLSLYVALSTKLYAVGPFAGLIEKEKDAVMFFTGMKVIALVFALVGLGVGVGTGNPDWVVEPCPVCEECPVVEQAPAQAPAPIPTQEITPAG